MVHSKIITQTVQLWPTVFVIVVREQLFCAVKDYHKHFVAFGA